MILPGKSVRCPVVRHPRKCPPPATRPASVIFQDATGPAEQAIPFDLSPLFFPSRHRCLQRPTRRLPCAADRVAIPLSALAPRASPTVRWSGIGGVVYSPMPPDCRTSGAVRRPQSGGILSPPDDRTRGKSILRKFTSAAPALRVTTSIRTAHRIPEIPCTHSPKFDRNKRIFTTSNAEA